MPESKNKRNIRFDSTILNSVQLCALRTKFYHVDNLRLPQTAVPLETGDLLHKMLEMYYLGVKEHGTALIYSDEDFKAHVEACIAFGEQYSVSLSINTEEVDETIKHF